MPAAAAPGEAQGDPDSSKTGVPLGGDSPGATGTDPTGLDGNGVVVHVAGAVLQPGVFGLPVDARVGDAVTAAGGLVVGADADRLNLAAPLADGARVFVPLVGQDIPTELLVEGPPNSGPGGIEQVIDINRADATALETLPGIGPATAAAILEHRERNGEFSSVEELLQVSGIGDAKLAALEGLVRVS